MKRCSAFHKPMREESSRWTRGRKPRLMQLIKMIFPTPFQRTPPANSVARPFQLREVVNYQQALERLGQLGPAQLEGLLLQNCQGDKTTLDYSQSPWLSRLNGARYSLQIARFLTASQKKLIRWKGGRKTMNVKVVKEKSKRAWSGEKDLLEAKRKAT